MVLQQLESLSMGKILSDILMSVTAYLIAFAGACMDS